MLRPPQSPPPGYSRSFPPGLALAAAALGRAKFRLDAAVSTGFTNLGTLGAAGDAQNGTTAGVDTNDVLALPYTGTRYVYCVGTNALSIPDAANLRPTVDFEATVKVKPDSWSTAQSLIGQRSSSVGNYCWYLHVNYGTAGRFGLTTSPDGTAIATAEASAAASQLTGSTEGWVRVNWRASDGRVQFFESLDGTTFTQIGTDRIATVGALFDSATFLTLGGHAQSAGSMLVGRLYGAVLKVNGATVVDFDANRDPLDTTHSSFTAATGQAVTINRDTTGRKTTVIEAPKWLLGTDDVIKGPVIDPGTADWTAIYVARTHNIAQDAFPGGSKNGLTVAAGWQVRQNGSAYLTFAADGTTIVSGATIAARPNGNKQVIVAQRAGTVIRTYVNGVSSGDISIAGLGSLSNAAPTYIGSTSGIGLPWDVELYAYAQWAEALSVVEIQAITSYMGAT